MFILGKIIHICVASRFSFFVMSLIYDVTQDIPVTLFLMNKIIFVCSKICFVNLFDKNLELSSDTKIIQLSVETSCSIHFFPA